MPVLQYRCPNCGKQFEELVAKFDAPVSCPECGGKCERVWSGTVYSSTGKPPKKCNGKCSECSGCT